MNVSAIDNPGGLNMPKEEGKKLVAELDEELKRKDLTETQYQ